MKTKIVSLFLAACMVLSMVGCGTKPAELHTEETSVEVESDTVSDSEEVHETVIEVTPDFRTLFPESLGLESDRMVRVKEITDMDGTEVVSLTEIYKSEEESYAYMDLNGIIVLKLYSQRDDAYVYVDMSEFTLSMLEDEDLNEIKAEVAAELEVSESELTDEAVKDYVKSQSVVYGYSKITEESSNPNAEAEEFLGTDDIENVFDKYTRSNLSLVSENKDKLVAKYEADGSDVVITLDKTSKEIEKIAFDYKEEDTISQKNLQVTNVEIEFLDPGQIDTSWATKDTKNTAEDAVWQFMMATLAFAFNQADFEEIQSAEGFNEIGFQIEDGVWEEN